MNPQQLAYRLHEVARHLESHISRLQGADLARPISDLDKKLDTFEKKLNAALEGSAPGMAELKLLLFARDHGRYLKKPELQRLLKKWFKVSAPPSASPKKLKDLICAEAAKGGQGEQTVALLQEYLVKAKALKQPVPKDKVLLGREFLRLGGLSDEAFDEEMEARWRTLTNIRKLASANGITTPKSKSKEDLMREIKQYCRRAHTNIR